MVTRPRQRRRKPIPSRNPAPLGIVGPVERVDERDTVISKAVKERLGATLKKRMREPVPEAIWRTVGTGVILECERQTMVLEFASVEDGVTFFETNFDPLALARVRLAAKGRWDALRGEVAGLMPEFNLAADRLRLPIGYLEAIGRLPG
jgi:hypothetical protein